MGGHRIKEMVWNTRNHFLEIPNLRLSELPDGSQEPVKLIVVLHCFHELSSYHALEALERLSGVDHLLVTGEDPVLLSQIYKTASALSSVDKVTMSLTERETKDTNAFISTLNELEISDSTVLLKLHGKSCKTFARKRWAFRCIDETVPSPMDCQKILGYLSQQSRPSAVVPLSSVAGIETNFKFLQSLKNIAGIKFRAQFKYVYPAGSMFWANGLFIQSFKRSVVIWDNDRIRGHHRSPELIERLLFADFDEKKSVTVYQSEYDFPLYTLSK
jgi:hypothetical protein